MQKRTPRTKSVPNSEGYSGALAEPMYPPRLLMSPEKLAEWPIRRATKMLLLFDHFGIDPTGDNAWRDLAGALAARHVPGFRPPPEKPGRPMERLDDDVTLVLMVDLLKRRDRKSVRGAIRVVVEKNAIAGTVPTLLDRYKKAVKKPALALIIGLIGRVAEKHGEAVVVEILEATIGPLI
jgi:hypothetical protein